MAGSERPPAAGNSRLGALLNHLAATDRQPASPCRAAPPTPPTPTHRPIVAAGVGAVGGMAGAPILSAADHEFWRENGYLVVPNAVPRAYCEAVKAVSLPPLCHPTLAHPSSAPH